MKKNMWVVIIVIFVFAGLLSALWYFQDYFFTKGFGLRQETPDWAAWTTALPAGVDVNDTWSAPDELRPGILLRYSDGSNSILLLKHSIGQGTYSFDLSSHQIGPVSDSAWSNATGEVVVCQLQRWRQQSACNMDNMRYRLITWDDKRTPQPTYGKYALEDVRSPSGKKTAILSAYGPMRPFFSFGYPGLGGADIKIYGQRYVQIMDLETKDYIDKPVLLWSGDDVPCFSSCWSSDEKILISYPCDFSNFQIVEPFAKR